MTNTPNSRLTMPKPYILTSFDSFEVTGRGRAYVVEVPYTYARGSKDSLIGKQVILDGKLVEVTAIDSFCIPTIRKGTKIGIIVKPVAPYISRRHFADLLHARMKIDDSIVVYTGDLGYMMFDQIRADFPDRYENVGAAEQLLLGAGVGAALSGKLPILYTITPFLFRAAEWMRNYLDHEQIRVKLVTSGLDDDYHHDGFSHHLFNLDTYMTTFPNVSTYLPAKAHADLERDFPTFISDPRASLMVLRK